MTVIAKTGQWKLAQAILQSTPDDLTKATKQALYQEGLHFVRAIKAIIHRGPTPPLALGKRREGPGRGGSKPLNASGDLLASVTAEPQGASDSVFVGVPRTAQGHGGQVVRLAETHEFGKTIVQEMTPKMRKFLFGVLFRDSPRKAGKGTRGLLVIHIPARPFIRPAFEAESPKSEDRVFRRLAHVLNGRIGTLGA